MRNGIQGQKKNNKNYIMKKNYIMTQNQKRTEVGIENHKTELVRKLENEKNPHERRQELAMRSTTDHPLQCFRTVHVLLRCFRLLNEPQPRGCGASGASWSNQQCWNIVMTEKIRMSAIRTQRHRQEYQPWQDAVQPSGTGVTASDREGRT